MTRFGEIGGKSRDKKKHGISNVSEVLGQRDDYELIPPVGRSRTIEAEEGRANLDLHRRITRVGGPQDRIDPKEVSEEAQEASLDVIFLAQLDETERYEKGFTFRVMAWVRMLLAAVELSAVKGAWGIWGPKVCGWMFFVSWFVAELVTIVASRYQLSEHEREKALKLSRQWRKSWDLGMKNHNSINDALSFSAPPEVQDDFSFGRATCTLLLCFNSWPLVADSGRTYFRAAMRLYVWAIASTLQPHWSVLAMIPVSSVVSTVIIWVAVYLGMLYVGLVYLVTSGWVLQGLNKGVLLLALRCGVSEKRLSRWRQAMKMEDSDGLVPGYLVLFQVILTILRYARVLNDYASYDCSTTIQASWYDWTL